MGDMAYFPAYFSYARTLEGLTDEQFGHVMRAAIQYAEHGTIPELNVLEKMGFAFIKEDIDRANERYQKVCESNKRNAQKRWNTQHEHTEDATACDRMRTDAKECDHMNAYAIHATASDRCESKGNSKREGNSKSKSESDTASDDAAPARTKTAKKQFVPPTVEEVAAYISEAGLSVDAERFVDYYAGNGWKVGSQGMKDWKATVRNWARRDRERGYDSKPKPAKPSAPASSSFDTDDFFDAALQRTYGDNWKFFKEGAEQ